MSDSEGITSTTIRLNVEIEEKKIVLNSDETIDNKGTTTTTTILNIDGVTVGQIVTNTIVKNEALDQVVEASTTTTTTPSIETKNMQSFEEWKEMKVKEERRAAQEQQQQKQQAAAAAAQNNNNIDDQSIIKESNKEQLTMKKNFASIDCGAKILSANPESSNPSHILTESRDDYMLNSCSNKIWFIVELCEPIKINELEIANFELFSNTPKQFSVYASERYPNKNWTKNFIGTYDAAAVRSVQLFNIKKSNNFQSQAQDNNNSEVINSEVQQIYIKYVKFEMLSHYGSEHYCPLSLVRIYGTSMDDDVVQTIEDNENTVHIVNQQNLTSEVLTTTSASEPLSTTTSGIVVALVNKTTSNEEANERAALEDVEEKQKLKFFNQFIDSIISYFIENQRLEFTRNDHVIDNDVLQKVVQILLCSNSKVNINCCQCLTPRSYANVSYCSYYFLTLTKCTSKLFADRYDKIIKQFNVSNNSSESNYTKITFNNINYLISKDLIYSLNDELAMNNSFQKDKKETISTLKTTTQQSVQLKTTETPIIDSIDSINQEIKSEEILPVTTTVSATQNSEIIEENIANEDKKLNLNEVETVQISTTPSPQQLPVSTPAPQQSTVSTSTKNIQLSNTNSGKDVIFMRLNNRIQALEINMSLSSQYLEQLSQHYRKQIDEMQKLFNKTTMALIDANKMSDERDSKQSERIKIIEKRLDSLQNTLNLYYYYISSYNNITSSSSSSSYSNQDRHTSGSQTTINSRLITESINSNSKFDEDDSRHSNRRCSVSPSAHDSPERANEMNSITTSLNFYIKKFNFEANYLSFLNYKFEFLFVILFFIILLNSCIVCIIVLIYRQRYLLLKVNLYENNKIYLKNVIDEQVNKYISELKAKNEYCNSNSEISKEKIENLSSLSATMRPTTISNYQRGDYTQQQQQQHNNQANAAAAVAVFAASTVAAVAFAASNVYSEQQQQSSNSNAPNLPTLIQQQ